MVHCQANLRQLTSAFLIYSLDGRDRLPGCPWDPGADWLGAGNGPNYSGREPQDGTLFRKYMGSQASAYLCPQDAFARMPNQAQYSYTGALLLSGAKTDSVIGAHYRESTDPLNQFSYNPTGHDRDMKPLPHAPLLIEEEKPGPGNVVDGVWGADDDITNRHFASDRPRGKGNIGYIDGHVGSVRLPNHLRPDSRLPFFQAISLCFRRSGSGWISGRSDTPAEGPYGFMDKAPPASRFGVYHTSLLR